MGLSGVSQGPEVTPSSGSKVSVDGARLAVGPADLAPSIDDALPVLGPAGRVQEVLCDRLLAYDIIRSLGEGAFGKVFLALENTSGEPVAIKVIERQWSNGRSEFHDCHMQELRFLQQMTLSAGRGFFVKLRESFVDSYNLYIVMVRFHVLSRRRVLTERIGS